MRSLRDEAALAEEAAAKEEHEFEKSAVNGLEKLSNPVERLRRGYIRNTNVYARVLLGLVWGGIFAGLGFAFPPLWCLAPLGFSIAFPEMAKTFMAFTLLAVLGVGIAMAAGSGGLLIPAALGTVASMTSVAGYFATATLGITMAIGGALSLLALVKLTVKAAKVIYRFGRAVSRASKFSDLTDEQLEQLEQVAAQDESQGLLTRRQGSSPEPDNYGTSSSRFVAPQATPYQPHQPATFAPAPLAANPPRSSFSSVATQVSRAQRGSIAPSAMLSQPMPADSVYDVARPSQQPLANLTQQQGGFSATSGLQTAGKAAYDSDEELADSGAATPTTLAKVADKLRQAPTITTPAAVDEDGLLDTWFAKQPSQ